MSEKHLTEKLWKDLVAKQAVKDIGLQKALVAYAKLDGTKEPGPTLEALKDISELALKLKKLCAAKADVVDHLDEVIKEVKKTTPALEAKVKAQKAEEEAEAKAAQTAAAKAPEKPAKKPEEEEEDSEADAEAEEAAEAAEFKKDLKKQMVTALAQVKMRAPGDPDQEKEPKPQLRFMAYLTSKVSAVIIAKKVGSATKKLLPEIAGGVSGGKFAFGECIFEKNAFTFVLDAVPSGLAKKLAAALVAETGAKYKVRARTTDGSTTLDDETDIDPDAASATAAKAAPTPAPPGSDTPGTPKEIKLSTYLSGRKNLRSAREQAEKELKRLQEAILAKAADEPFFKDVEAKSQRLFDYLAPIDDAVANKLDDAGRCTDAEEQAVKNQEVRKLIQKQLTSLRSHPLAAFVEKNPFGKFIIKQPLEVTLSALDKQLG